MPDEVDACPFQLSVVYARYRGALENAYEDVGDCPANRYGPQYQACLSEALHGKQAVVQRQEGHFVETVGERI